MIFTKKYKIERIEPLEYEGEKIEYVTSTKYLGVVLDLKLHWKLHANREIGKTFASFFACRKAMGKDWGFSPKVSLWLYEMVLLLRLTYAAVVWWPRVQKEETKIRLRSLSDNFLRAATGAMKTKPFDALEVALNWLSLDLLMIEKAEATTYRLKCQGEWIRSSAEHAKLKSMARHPLNEK